MKYVADTVGVEVSAEPWGGADKRSYYLIDRYEFKKAASVRRRSVPVNEAKERT